MLTSKSKPDSWREALRFISRCPVCNTAYEGDHAKLFAKNNAASLVHITCANCQSGFVAMILIMGHGLSSVGMVTDLNFEDVKKLHLAEAINLDEIIEWHTQIHDENFVKLITK